MIKKVSWLLLCILLVLAIAVGCSPAQTDEGSATANTSPDQQSDDAIAIVGLSDGDLTFTVDELKGMDGVEDDMESLDSQGEIIKKHVKGVTLDSILSQHSAKQKDYYVIRVTATDGYVVEIPKYVIDSEDIILAYEIDGEALDEESAPVRIVINNVRALYWARMVSKIELISDVEQASVNRVVFLEGTYAQLEKHDYEYFADDVSSTDTAVKMSDVLGLYAKGESSEDCVIVSSDGLKKTQQKYIVEQFSLKIDGANAPLLASKDVPVGMHVKEVFSIRIGSTEFESLAAKLKESTKIKLSDVATWAELEGDAFILAAADDYSKEVSSDELSNWYVEYAEDGNSLIAYKDGEKDKAIKDFISITVK